jgi:hypothetical protein
VVVGGGRLEDDVVEDVVEVDPLFHRFVPSESVGMLPPTMASFKGKAPSWLAPSTPQSVP